MKFFMSDLKLVLLHQILAISCFAKFTTKYKMLLNNYCCKLEATEWMLFSSGKGRLGESAP